MPLDRLSIEPSTRCAKACWFCYNRIGPGAPERNAVSPAPGSRPPEAPPAWTPAELIAFATDCAAHGLRAVSFGGGEPLEYEGLVDVLAALRGKLFRSITTNGLRLNTSTIAALAGTGLDKAHVSIHFPERPEEVGRVIEQVRELEAAGIRSGVNLLVAAATLDAAREAARRLREAGIGPERTILLPLRLHGSHGSPTPAELASVADGHPFQATSCLQQCAPSPRFASLDAGKAVGWCSYTTARRPLAELTWRGLMQALDGLELKPCRREGAGEAATARPEA